MRSARMPPRVTDIMFKLARLSERVPWQVSGGVAWCTGFSIHIFSAVWERECPAAAAAHAGESHTPVRHSHLELLRRDGYVVVDGCLSVPELAAARDECAAFKTNGAFEVTEQHASDVRTDRILWVREGCAGLSVLQRLFIFRTIPLGVRVRSLRVPIQPDGAEYAT